MLAARGFLDGVQYFLGVAGSLRGVAERVVSLDQRRVVRLAQPAHLVEVEFWFLLGFTVGYDDDDRRARGARSGILENLLERAAMNHPVVQHCPWRGPRLRGRLARRCL